MRYFILTLLFSFIFSECDDLNVLQCSSNADCEWIEDIDYGSCGSLGAGECNSTPGCNWECGFSHGSCYWCCWYECGGGSYEIDNSYCQENPNPPSCSEMGQSQCNNSDCEWVEDIETENCYDILDCTGGCTWQDCEAIEGCNWHFGTAYYDPSYCYGEHIIDNSYCEESNYIQGDLNGDLIVNVLDAIIIVDIILNQESSDLADINGDGGVNVLDVIELVELIINT